VTWAPLLLADSSPCLRRLVLQNLLHKTDSDLEVRELTVLLEEDPIVSTFLATQASDGSWKEADVNGSVPGGRIQATSQVLNRFGYLGFEKGYGPVDRAVEFLFSKQRQDGSWQLSEKWEEEERLPGPYTMMPLQTAIPLMGPVSCGYACDPRAELAYEWLLDQQLNDGAWPTGKAGEVYGYVAGYRRLPHSRWGCRSNTTATLICLAVHPTRCVKSETRKALDLLLGRETRERQNIGFNVARIVGAEPQSGYLTYYARFDLALILDLCWRIGADTSDARVDELVKFILDQRNPFGLWKYIPHPEASRWVTYDLLHSLSHIDESRDWLSLEPRTRFRAYPRRRKRF
jgi:hypothetical protein